MASTSTTTYLVLTVLAVAVCLLGPGVHACNYPDAEGRHNITFGTKGPKDVLLHNFVHYLNLEVSVKVSGNFCYPDEKSNDKVRITQYTLEAGNNQGLVYLSKEKRLDEHRVCFHVKTLGIPAMYHFKNHV